MGIKERILNVFNEIGVLFDNDCIDKNTDLSFYLEDSIVFVQFVVALEEAFEVEIPDEYLSYERMGTLEKVENIIYELITK